MERRVAKMCGYEPSPSWGHPRAKAVLGTSPEHAYRKARGGFPVPFNGSGSTHTPHASPTPPRSTRWAWLKPQMRQSLQTNLRWSRAREFAKGIEKAQMQSPPSRATLQRLTMRRPASRVARQKI